MHIEQTLGFRDFDLGLYVVDFWGLGVLVRAITWFMDSRNCIIFHVFQCTEEVIVALMHIIFLINLYCM